MDLSHPRPSMTWSLETYATHDRTPDEHAPVLFVPVSLLLPQLSTKMNGILILSLHTSGDSCVNTDITPGKKDARPDFFHALPHRRLPRCKAAMGDRRMQ